MTVLTSLYHVSLYILNHSPYGKNEPMELGLFSRILFDANASQIYSYASVIIKDYWEINEEKDMIFPKSFEKMISSDKYKIWIEGDKICTDQDANLDYLSEITKETLDNHLRLPAGCSWTIETWYRVKMSPSFKNSNIFEDKKKITPPNILEYVYNNVKSCVEEQFFLDQSCGNYYN